MFLLHGSVEFLTRLKKSKVGHSTVEEGKKRNDVRKCLLRYGVMWATMTIEIANCRRCGHLFLFIYNKLLSNNETLQSQCCSLVADSTLICQNQTFLEKSIKQISNSLNIFKDSFFNHKLYIF